MLQMPLLLTITAIGFSGGINENYIIWKEKKDTKK